MNVQPSLNASPGCGAPTWDLVKDPPPAVRFLDERNPDRNEALELFGQEAALRTIQSAILGAFHSPDARSRSTRIIALLGRFGQGKTRVLTQLVDWLDGKTTLFEGFRYPRRVQVFRISEFQQQEVAAAFDAFIGRKHLLLRTLLGFGLAVLTAVSASAGILLLTTVLELAVGTDFVRKFVEPGAIKILFGATLAGGVALFCGATVWSFWRREVDVRASYSNIESICRLVLEIFQTTDVLLIDDFDRATTEQQVAILWTLRRRRDDLRTAVIVAFDETPFARGEQGALTQELLEKTFDVAVRLNPITRHDAEQMATGFTQHLLSLNPGIPAAQLLNDPIVISDLARVFLLLGRASARFAKRFLNRVLASVYQLGLQAPDDVSGLIRLLGLYELVPWIESDAERLGDILSRNDPEAFLTHVETRRGSVLPGNIRESVQAYVAGTSRLQPSLGNWDRVLAIWTNVQATGSHDVNQEIKLSSRFYDGWLAETGAHAQRMRSTMIANWLSWDLAILLEGKELDRRAMYSLCRTKICQPVDPAFSDRVEPLLNEKTDATTHAALLLWLYLLDRTRIADPYLPTEEMRSLAFPSDELGNDLPEEVREEALNAWRRLPLIHPHAPLSLPERAELACSALPDRSMEPAISRLFKQKRNAELASFLLPADLRVFGIRYSELKHPERRFFLERHWPTFSDDQADSNFEALAVLAPWRPIAPRAHRLWLFEKSRAGNDERIFRSLLKLIADPKQASDWPIEIVKPLLQGRADDEFQPDDYKGVTAALARQCVTSNHGGDTRALFLLASTDEYEAVDAILSHRPPPQLMPGWVFAIGNIRSDRPIFSSRLDHSSWRDKVDIFFDQNLSRLQSIVMAAENEAGRSQALLDLDLMRSAAALWKR